MNHTDACVDATCPTEETLTAYLAAIGALPAELVADWSSDALGDEEVQALSAHVGTCDRCLEELRVASRRLALAAEIPLPVPADVVARTVAAGSQSPAVPDRKPSWLAGLREWLEATIRMPVLVPVALAALALIVIVPRLQTPTGSDAELSRSVEIRQVARVTVDTALVRAARDDGAAILATLTRGDRAVLIGEQDGWYHVSLADGAEGWIERSAFD